MVETSCTELGNLYGNGLYFSDVVSKAALRCQASRSKPFGYLMVYQVYTGLEYKISRTKVFKRPPDGFHSVKGVGRHAPEQVHGYNGAEYLGGEPVKNMEEITELRVKQSSLNHNEYVVYDHAQVKPVFLAKVVFHFK